MTKYLWLLAGPVLPLLLCINFIADQTGGSAKFKPQREAECRQAIVQACDAGDYAAVEILVFQWTRIAPGGLSPSSEATVIMDSASMSAREKLDHIRWLVSKDKKEAKVNGRTYHNLTQQAATAFTIFIVVVAATLFMKHGVNVNIHEQWSDPSLTTQIMVDHPDGTVTVEEVPRFSPNTPYSEDEAMNIVFLMILPFVLVLAVAGFGNGL